MTGLLTFLVPLAVLAGLVLWARRRTQRFREAARQREEQALQAVLDAVRQQKAGPAVPEAAARPLQAAAPAMPFAGAAAGATLPPASAPLPSASAPLPPSDAPLPSADRPRVGTLAPLEFAAAMPTLAPVEVAEASAPARTTSDPIGAVVAGSVTESPAPAPEAAATALPELALAWYEARGYRMARSSPAEWPVQGVLRHREDPARAYAFVVQSDYVSLDRITALAERAREVGLKRVALVVTGGYEAGAKEAARERHVRLIDQPTMDAELGGLKKETVQRIVALARSRTVEQIAA